MVDSCWEINETGFLISPDPVEMLPPHTGIISAEAAEHLQYLSEHLPEHIETGRLRSILDSLPLYSFIDKQPHEGSHLIERLHQIYSFLANAYIWDHTHEPKKYIPAGVAVPLVQLSQIIDRPPIMAYADYTLSNWQRKNPNGKIEVENLQLIQKMVNSPDSSWFTLIHVEIEAEAGVVIQAFKDAFVAVSGRDVEELMGAFESICVGFDEMIRTFQRMTEGCNPDVYFHRIRPYLFGFENVIYEGVELFKGKPQSFRGETGAQSSIIPTVVAALGIQHTKTVLVQELNIMRGYMPKPHREFLAQIDSTLIRSTVRQTGNMHLTEIYNECLLKLLAFRKLHYHFAIAYIANKLENPQGTGGTLFVDWLQQLIDETEAQLL